MSVELSRRLFEELVKIPLIDPHSHINPYAPASKTLGDILGYHYYTELAHSAGLPKAEIEQPGISQKEMVSRLVPKLSALENTVQYSWLVEMAQQLLGFEGTTVNESNWEGLYDLAEKKMRDPGWENEVLQKSNLEQVFLTNDFDDPLTGFNTDRYIPCLRTDDLVFHLGRAEVRERLTKATGFQFTSAVALKRAIGRLFEHFVAKGARACAISLPPDFTPEPASDDSIDSIAAAIHAGRDLHAEEHEALKCFVFWTLAKMCVEFKLPFDLMIGVNRRVYPTGVYQGQDLFDQRVSLIQYRRLFNAFPQVTFPISVLASASNQELVSYAWIFPNVVVNGHWWYSNIPAYIEPDCRARLQVVPRTKQIGYYSDMYKLEFGLPKFNMYRRVLSKVLAEDFVIARNWTEEQAVGLGKQILRDNVEAIFPCRKK